MKIKIILLLTTMSVFSFAHAKYISCDNGFILDTDSRYLEIELNGYTRQLQSYLSFEYPRHLYADNLLWNDFHNAYFKSDEQSTIKIYYYNDENALSLVAEHAGTPAKQIKFGHCNF